MNFFKGKWYLAGGFIMVLQFSAGCSAPKKWEGSPYIATGNPAGSGGAWDFSGFQPGIIVPENRGKDVKVLIHSGSAVNVSAGKYSFKPLNGSITTGSGNLKASVPGDFTPLSGSFTLRGRNYAGTLQIRNSGKKIYYINVVSEDDYLTSVVSHEMSPTWPKEALKAQAVVARTYLYQKQKETSRTLYDVDSTTNHQVYKGIAKGDINARKAVAESRGEVVTYNSQLAQVFFYSCAGGHTAAASEVWTADLPYLIAQKSDYCKGAPVYRWKTRINKKTMEARLGVKGIKKITIVSRSKSKRAYKIKIAHSGGTKIMKGTQFRAQLGAAKVKSTLFGIRYKNGSFEIAGKGYGHGVGMDQWGTKFMVEKYNKSYRDVIAHYFPGTSISTMTSGSTSS